MEVLENKLNKYLIKFIQQYAIIDLSSLITKELPFRYISIFSDITLSIEDIFIKCYERGYKGFFVDRKYVKLWTNIDLKITNEVIKINGIIEHCCYHVKNDKRNLRLINIIDLKGVVLENIIETKN